MSGTCSKDAVCPGCGKAFTCGMAAGWVRCWCAEQPPLQALPDSGKGCYCPDCLREKLAQTPVMLADPAGEA